MKKAERIYKVTLEDRSRLREVKSFTFTLRRAIVAGFLTLLLLSAVFVLLFCISPLRSVFHADSEADCDENRIVELMTRLDSLNTKAEINNRFFNNLRDVLDTDREPKDSLAAGVLLKSLPVDSLMTGSPAERRFVASMGEREKYNLQVLSPVAADGMIFSNPVEGGIIAEESGNRFMVRMIVPLGSGVCSVADGIVVDNYISATSDRYTVIIQHPNGFVSRYTDVPTPLIDNGTIVFAGQAITAPARPSGSAKSGATIGVELWHDGTPLYPADYIYRMDNR